jgi:hypothetical protein
VPPQLLVCSIAVRRGWDVDQSRTLAKDVTVEQPRRRRDAHWRRDTSFTRAATAAAMIRWPVSLG